MRNFRSFRGSIARGTGATGMRRTAIARKSPREWKGCARNIASARVRTAAQTARGNRRNCSWDSIKEGNHAPHKIERAGKPETQEVRIAADRGLGCAGGSETGAWHEVETCLYDYDGCGFPMFVCILGRTRGCI